MLFSSRKWALFTAISALGVVLIPQAYCAILDSGQEAVTVQKTPQSVSITTNHFVAIQAPQQDNVQDALLAKIESAKSQFRPMSEGRINQKKAELRSALAKANSILRKSPSNAAGWNSYLQLADLQEQVNPSVKADLRLLNGIRERMYVNESGLELKQFTGLRKALTGYMNAVYFASLEKSEDTYESQLDKLATAVKAAQDDPAAAVDAGRIIGWLDRFDLAPSVVSAANNRYGAVNLYASVSENLANRGFADSVSQVSTICDNILGTSIRATVHTEGSYSVDFQPSTSSASIGVRLKGNASSTSVGTNRSVTIHSTGNTTIDATANLRFDGERLTASPASARCATDNTINCISHRLKIVEKMAWKKARESECQAESIASRRAEARVAKQMNSQVAELVRDANKSYKEKAKDPLVRKDARPQRLDVSTTSNGLHLAVLQRNSFQVGATTSVPSLDGNYDLAVRAHATSINNFLESILGGLKLTDERMAEMAKEMTGKVPPALQSGPEDDPWSITFSRELPLSVQIEDDTLTIAVRGRRFSRAEQEIRSAMTIAATYKVSRTPTGSKLTRVGDVKAEYTSARGQQGVAQVAFKTFISKKFEGFFKEEFASDGLKLPGKLANVGRLQLEQLQADNGWLVLGWNMGSGEQVARTR